jgi:hypothetical protein
MHSTSIERPTHEPRHWQARTPVRDLRCSDVRSGTSLQDMDTEVRRNLAEPIRAGDIGRAEHCADIGLGVREQDSRYESGPEIRPAWVSLENSGARGSRVTQSSSFSIRSA